MRVHDAPDRLIDIGAMGRAIRLALGLGIARGGSRYQRRAVVGGEPGVERPVRPSTTRTIGVGPKTGQRCCSQLRIAPVSALVAMAW